MKKISLLHAGIVCIGVLAAGAALACIGSNCKPCPEGYDMLKKCCSATDKENCIFLNDEVEDCGVGLWSEYPNSLDIKNNECCKDATENNCRFIRYKEYCGRGEFAEYPYAPIKMCCKDTEGRDCVTIRAKRKCGEYQLEEYPLTTPDCCHSFLQKCTGKVNDCPKCL